MNRTATWMLLVLLTLVVAAGLARQWQTTVLLQIEAESLREGTRDLARLRAQNERLKRERPPVAAVERMRADHAAMEQLRTELEKLREASSRR